MSSHNTSSGHEIALSFTDGSIWCYACDSYITTPALTALQCKFSSIKFPDGDDREALEELIKAFDQSLTFEDKKKEEEPKFDMIDKKYTREKLIKDIK